MGTSFLSCVSKISSWGGIYDLQASEQPFPCHFLSRFVPCKSSTPDMQTQKRTDHPYHYSKKAALHSFKLVTVVEGNPPFCIDKRLSDCHHLKWWLTIRIVELHSGRFMHPSSRERDHQNHPYDYSEKTSLHVVNTVWILDKWLSD